MSQRPLSRLVERIRGCDLCSGDLPAGPRPIVQAAEGAKILIAGQAPGRRVHETGKPFDDPSGDRLRSWLGVTKEMFYDPSLFAIVPMGFCYPGTMPSGRGDAPPRPECRKTWHNTLFSHLPTIGLRVILGRYALEYHAPHLRKASLVEAVRWSSENWQKDGILILPHPSPRNVNWLKNNGWVEAEFVPIIRKQIANLTQQRPQA